MGAVEILFIIIINCAQTFFPVLSGQHQGVDVHQHGKAKAIQTLKQKKAIYE